MTVKSAGSSRNAAGELSNDAQRRRGEKWLRDITRICWFFFKMISSGLAARVRNCDIHSTVYVFEMIVE